MLLGHFLLSLSEYHYICTNYKTKVMHRIYIIFFLLAILQTNISAQTKSDSPREGEGLNAFLKRNGCTTTECRNQFLELNKNKLGKNNSLIKGKAYNFPSAEVKDTTSVKEKDASTQTPQTASTQKGVKQKNKLFGPKYEEYTVKSDKLKGTCFFLSSGHGGPDSGAVGKVDGKELHEDEYAYDITLRLARNLLEEGATVHMIIQDAKDGIRDDKYLANNDRETCMGATIPISQKKRLRQRGDKINSLAKASKAKYKRAVFIHLDSRSQKKQLDVFFYYAKNSSGGKKLANTMRQTFFDHYAKHQPNRGFTGTVTTRNLYMLDYTTPVGIFAELGNMHNSFDQRRYLDPNNRQALANWMCRGFIKDYENWKAGK